VYSDRGPAIKVGLEISRVSPPSVGAMAYVVSEQTEDTVTHPLAETASLQTTMAAAIQRNVDFLGRLPGSASI